MVVEDWEAKHEAVRRTWKLQDLIQLVVDAVSAAIEVQQSLVTQTLQPCEPSEATRNVGYFLQLSEQLLVSAGLVEDRVSVFESEGHSVESADSLRQSVSRLAQIVGELRAVVEEAEWHEIDQQALTNDELLEIRDYLRSSGQASA